MVQILSPPAPTIPEPPPGMVLSVMPAPHVIWLDDFEYYNQLGQDPFQQRNIWAISDDVERANALNEVIESFPKTRHRRRMLQTVAERGDEALLRCLVEKNFVIYPDIEKAKKEYEEGQLDEDEGVADNDEPDIKPLHLAAMAGHLGCVKILLEEGRVDLEVLDEYGRTPLLAAAHKCKLEVMKYLLHKGANPTARSFADDESAKQFLGAYAGADALEMVAAHGDVEVLELLLSHPIYGSTQNRQYREGVEPGVWVTPLAIQAAAGNRCEALSLLLSRGGYPVSDKDGKTKRELLSEEQRQTLADALPEALDFAELATLKLVLSYLYPVDDDGELLPFELPENLHKRCVYGAYGAVQKNRVDKFEYLNSFGIKEHDTMSLDPLPEGQLLNLQHLLDSAAEHGSLDCVKLLIEKYGAQPDKHRVPTVIRPVYMAAAANKVEVVRYLLENHDIDLHVGNGRYSAGATALYIAICLKSLDTIPILLQHGGPVDEINEEIRTIDQPMTTVLKADFTGITPRVLLQTEAHVQDYLDSTRHNWQRPNPSHVLLHLTPDDKTWIEKLQIRRDMEELREVGEGARELNEEEGVKMDDLDLSDVRRVMPQGVPTLQWRQNELDQIKDVLPRWQPMFA